MLDSIISFPKSPDNSQAGDVSSLHLLFIDTFVKIVYHFYIVRFLTFWEVNFLEKQIRPNLTVTQLARIVNQLHRIAITHSCDCVDSPPPGGMTVSQVSTLGYLLLQDGSDVYQKDIEQFFKLRRSTVSSMLNTLEKKGFIQRQAVPHDARLKKLVLTEYGRQLSSLAGQIFLQINELMVQGLTQEELATLSTLLEKIETNLSKDEL